MEQKKIINIFKISNKKKELDEFINGLYNKKSINFIKIEEAFIYSLFKEALLSVVAYKSFIVTSKVDLTLIKSYKTMQDVPSINKKEYLRKYDWRDLSKKNALRNIPLVITSSSGSTGEPFYFSRTHDADILTALYYKMFLKSAGINSKQSTLVIDCFGMGIWIGGLITYQAFKYLSDIGHPLSIVTPGINKKEIFQVMKNLGKNYDTIILCGYPPFLKDLIDEAKDNGIIWSDYTIKVMFAAESFSENFRDYIAKKVGIKNIYRDTMSIYGTADVGTMASEMGLGILVKRLALSNNKVYERLFGQSTRMPTLAQYIPNFIGFEEKNSSIYCSGNSSMSLVRYQIGDSGNVLTYQKIEEILKDGGIDLHKEIKQAGLAGLVTELPFVCIYERSDFSTKLYGAIIYPEYIKHGLENKKIEESVSGKFTMTVERDSKEDPCLIVNVELKQNIKETKTLHSEVTKALYEGLLERSAEYKNNASLLSKEKVVPRVFFWQHGDETYFSLKGKQKWLK